MNEERKQDNELHDYELQDKELENKALSHPGLFMILMDMKTMSKKKIAYQTIGLILMEIFIGICFVFFFPQEQLVRITVCVIVSMIILICILTILALIKSSSKSLQSLDREISKQSGQRVTQIKNDKK